MASLGIKGRNSGEAPDTGVPLLSRPSLHQQIVAVLRTMIFEGQLPPGARIAETQLCRQLGVSRTPLREALKVLASDRLIELLPNRGAVVAQITIEETVELFEVLEGLEAMVGELAVQRITDAELGELRAHHRDMLEHHQRGRRAEYFACNQWVHHRLVESTRNRTLAAAHLNYSQKIMRARYAANFTQLRWDESAQEHAHIIAALERRDGALLSNLLREHLRRTARSVLATLRSTTRLSERGP